ncbi:SDR family oxidoreductase [Rhodococcus sp. KBS0724]|uniref:SDR family oxidoreductase n=1 Tax=Rhodococcus sp. KBS0724 TaxID=1179674 RepID=UPI00110F2404|nr:SDR family NAD(P)-dependent oxidoreductase [Rhodococcus sp. KBS0724]TSD40415.1 SDR family oxidoreductase [Rhodococcus sp. KBS0724]
MSEIQQVAVITGAGSGIGEATAKRFAKSGHAVLVVDINADAASRVATEITDAGGTADFTAFDVRSAAGWKEAVEKAVSAWGRVDVLYNNAGIFQDSRVSKMTEEQWDAVVDISLKGAFLGAREVFPIMSDQKFGRLIATSSTALQGIFGQANYSAAKGGLVSMTKSLALEGARYGITANAVAPGSINTPLMLSMSEEHLEKYKAEIPMQRFGDPDEVAAVVEFLSSREAAYVTGQLIYVCGGASFGG